MKNPIPRTSPLAFVLLALVPLFGSSCTSPDSERSAREGASESSVAATSQEASPIDRARSTATPESSTAPPNDTTGTPDPEPHSLQVAAADGATPSTSAPDTDSSTSSAAPLAVPAPPNAGTAPRTRTPEQERILRDALGDENYEALLADEAEQAAREANAKPQELPELVKRGPKPKWVDEPGAYDGDRPADSIVVVGEAQVRAQQYESAFRSAQANARVRIVQRKVPSELTVESSTDGSVTRTVTKGTVVRRSTTWEPGRPDGRSIALSTDGKTTGTQFKEAWLSEDGATMYVLAVEPK